MLKSLKTSYYRMAAAGTVAALSLSNPAHAGGDGIGGIFSSFTENLEQAPALLAIVAYIGGAALGIAGIFKLKQHVDSPQQVPMKDGLMRLVGGAALIAIPFVLQAIINTIGGAEGNFDVPEL